MKKTIFSLVFIILSASASWAQSRTMYVGDIELRLGMSQDTVMKLLSKKYTVTPLGSRSMSVTQFDAHTKIYESIGVIGFDNNELTYISRDIDTSGWPNDEGYAVARAIYDALNGSIPLTDSDGGKRASARIAIGNYDVATKPVKGNMRSIVVAINDQRITITMSDSTNVQSVSVSVSIQTKPW